MKIKHLLAVFTVILSINSAFSQDKKFKVHTVAFYNFENLFDTINDPDTYDEEYDEDDLQDEVLTANPIINELSNGEEVITLANAGRIYKAFSKIAVEIAEEEAKTFRAEAEAEIKAIQPRRVGEGSARANAGMLGIGFDDRLNDPYLSYLSTRA